MAETTSSSSVGALPTAPLKARGARRVLGRDFALRLAFIVLILVSWQVAHYFLVVRTHNAARSAVFPSPSEVAARLLDGFGLSYWTGHFHPRRGQAMPSNFWAALRQADYPPAIIASIVRLVEGYAIATMLGFPLGLLIARSPWVEKTLGWLAVSLQSLPSICWIPLAILWFKPLGVTPPILFVTVMGSLFATVVTVAEGIRNVPPLLARAGRTLGATGPRLYFSVLLPAALPGIIAGLKVGWAFTWRSLMAAELIADGGGLGFLLHRDRDNANGVLATIFVIIVIGIGVQDWLFAPLQRRLQTLWGLTGVRS